MLLQIRDYISQHKVVSTQQLARAFQLEPQALQPMLDVWLQKKVIVKCQEKTNCQSSCFKCRASVEYYEYKKVPD